MSRRTAIEPTREQNYPDWYQEVIKSAELAEVSGVRGCMVIKPWGYALWENIQKVLDKMFKDTGHVNAYFPLLIPLSYLQKEAEHVEGFAKECAVVTHSRLTWDEGQKKLVPDSELEEPFIIRPTSETIIGETYKNWVQSYRDLPILINQWANVMRWEMRTRLFLRTSEFLWQEGHTVHATQEEAEEETARMLGVYEDFAKNFAALPVICGEKPMVERFPGAVNTYAIECMMQDRKALQAGTSHFLGQRFAEAAGIKFLDRDEKIKTAWTTSWGVSTRLIGAIVMTHSDDDGLVLPPRLAPQQIAIIPVLKAESAAEVLSYCDDLKKQLEGLTAFGQPIRAEVLKKDTGLGQKKWDVIKRGYPLRIEIGPKDIAQDSLVVSARIPDPLEKQILSREALLGSVTKTLEDLQTMMLNKARTFQAAHSKTVANLEELTTFFGDKDDNLAPGFAYAFAEDTAELNNHIKHLKITARCIPSGSKTGRCIFSGKEGARQMIFAKAY